ncbi:MAG: HIT domain-containing protein [Nanoarchaeota archaeon]
MNCPACTPKGTILYQDEDSLILVPSAPSIPGHLQVLSKTHNKLVDLNAEQTQHLFHLANYTAASLFEVLQAQGTNILVHEGIEEHAVLNVLSRKMEDGLSFQWEPKSIPAAEMDEIAQKIRDQIFPNAEKRPEKKETAPQEKIIQIEKQLEAVKDKIVDTPEKENYMLKQLERIP